jgi:hypothetical protein
MIPNLCRSITLLFLGLTIAPCSAASVPARAAPPPPETPTMRQARELRDKLTHPVSLEKGIDANTKLQDALDFLSDRYDLTMVIDTLAFKADLGKDDFEKVTVTLPRMRDVKLSTVLGMLTDQFSGTYLVRADHIVITTPQRDRPEEWTGRNRHRAALVNVELDKRPLEEALKELSSLTGINITVDPRVAEGAKTAVTATLINAPLDSSVRLLADMAGLRAAAVDNILYVTTKENADRLNAEQGKARTLDAQPARMPKIEEKGAAPAVDKTKAAAEKKSGK